MPEKNAIDYLPSALSILAEVIKLIHAIKQQNNLSTEEIWARADAQVQANRGEIETFLAGL